MHDAGEDVLLVEAKDRLGGRARSVALSSMMSREGERGVAHAPHAQGSSEGRSDPALPDWVPASAGTQGKVDLGCGWLHSARRNPWTRIAEATGFTVDRSPANWRTQWRDLGFPPAEQDAAHAAYARFNDAALAALDGPDRPLSDFVVADDPWRPMIDSISGYANGAPLAQVSLHDWAAYEEASTDDNWAVREGYGTLIVAQANGVPVRLGTPVTRIDHRGRRLRIDTAAGMIEADRVIVALPTTAYARLVFDPPLPAKQHAAAALPLGLADKAFTLVDRPDWPANAHLTGNPHINCTASHRLSPFGLPVVESFFGGACAEALEDEGAANAFAIDELVALLGGDWRRRLTPAGASRWRHEPFIHGSYSHAMVGQAHQRQALGEPVDDRIFFAGEACHASDFSTAHGAYETGMAAAAAILSPVR